MLPRRTSMSRSLFMGSCLVFCIWIWTLQPEDNVVKSSYDFPDFQISHASVFSKVKEALDRSHESVLNKNDSYRPLSDERDGSSRQRNSHEHQNQTLEQLKRNMTMLKANMSSIGEILQIMNQSVDHSLVNVPNPHPFKYLIHTEAVCKGVDLFLLAYVHTAPDHYKRRMVIRQTWGNPKYYKDIKIRVVFVMGRTENKSEVQDALEFEAEQYHDIVQEDFLDTYRNLTYKGIAAVKWISNHCRNAKFVLKSDDDIFVNTFTLFRHLKSLEQTGIDNKGLLMCLVWSRMKVMREGKWKVDREEFKDDYYPTYCSGSAFTMSTDVAIALHNISYHVPFFWVDDFYITGLLPLKLGTIKHKQFMSTYVLDGRKLEEKFTGSQWFTYIFSHVHDLNAIQSVWEKLVKLANGEERPAVKFALPGQLPDEAEFKRKEKEEADKKAKEKKAKDDKKKQEEAAKKKQIMK